MKPEDVLAFYGSPHKFKKRTGMSHTSLYNWLKWGYVPLEAQGKIQGFTEGQLKAEFKSENEAVVNVKNMQRFTYYLTEEKKSIPCDPKKWLSQYELLSRDNKRCVGNEIIKGYQVLTLWHGLDLFFGLLNPKLQAPLLFETLIFKGIDELYCVHYSTWNEALNGHEKAKDWLHNHLNKKESK